MTRETKIGLLVGLAFIIVIGILLSDHLTSSNDPPPATLAGAGTTVRQTVSTPGGTQPPPQPVSAPQVQLQSPVPTPRELQPQTPVTSIVQVGGPSVALQGGQTPAPPMVQPQAEPPVTIVSTSQPPQQQQPEQQVVGADPPVTFVPPNHPVAQVAQQHGEALVTLTPSAPTQVTAPASRTSPTGVTEYTAQPGDTLSQIAIKMLGSSSKANIDAIIRLNPSLQADPNKVIQGRKYKVPTASGVASAAPAAPTTAQPAIAQAPAPTVGPTEYWYTVKEGDSLWRIANEQLGKGGSGVAAIKELNKDILNGSDTVRPNMRLRMPGKPLVQAN